MTTGLGRYLIVNADDYGQSLGVNSGVARAHERGIVTSTSLMVRWPTAEQAAEYARAHPAMSVGLHVDLGEWIPCDGHWEPVYEVVPPDDCDQVAAEVDRQLKRFQELMSCDPTHLDSHQHVHRSEPVRSVLEARARALAVPLRDCNSEVRYCSSFYGQTGDGVPRPQAIAARGLVEVLTSLDAGVTELGCHPGHDNDVESLYGAERALEVEAFCDPSVQEVLSVQQIQLCAFHTRPRS